VYLGARGLGLKGHGQNDLAAERSRFDGVDVAFRSGKVLRGAAHELFPSVEYVRAVRILTDGWFVSLLRCVAPTALSVGDHCTQRLRAGLTCGAPPALD